MARNLFRNFENGITLRVVRPKTVCKCQSFVTTQNSLMISFRIRPCNVIKMNIKQESDLVSLQTPQTMIYPFVESYCFWSSLNLKGFSLQFSFQRAFPLWRSHSWGVSTSLILPCTTFLGILNTNRH